MVKTYCRDMWLANVYKLLCLYVEIAKLKEQRFRTAK